MAGWFSEMYVDGEPVGERDVAKRAGVFLTLSQLPGFIITVTAFTNQHAFGELQEGATSLFFFPLGGIGEFLLISYLLSSKAWAWQMQSEKVATTDQAIKFGFLLGAVVHAVVFSIGITLGGFSAFDLGILTEIAGTVLLTYSIGWTTSAGAAIGSWFLEVLRKRSIKPTYEETDDELPVSHVCASCGEQYRTNPDAQINQCRKCGGIKVEPSSDASGS
jgi:ribosomal protein L37AE/L43A